MKRVAIIIYVLVMLGSCFLIAKSEVAPLTRKWQITLPVGYGHFHPCMGDVDNDSIQEIVLKYGDYVTVLNGKTGALEWISPKDGAGGATMLELADLNGDGTPEIVYCGDGLSVYARDGVGNLLWKSARVNGAGWSGTPIVTGDTNGDGRSEIFVVTADNVSPYTACVTKLNSSGSVMATSEICYQPCWGGLALADANFDGRFEVYLGDRASRGGPGGSSVSYPSNPARGLSCYDADTLGTLWTRGDLYHSSPAPALIDVTGDGKLEVIGNNILNNGVCVVDAVTGQDVYNWKGRPINNHAKGTVWDIDLDGHVELISAWGYSNDPKCTKDFTVLDLVTGNVDYRASEINNWITYPPTVGDVDGDGYMDILVATSSEEGHGEVGQGMFYAYNRNYQIIQTISDFPYGQQLWEPYCVDCDGDGYSEVLIANNKGLVWCYDTPARPNPALKTWSAWYSPSRQGAASVVPTVDQDASASEKTLGKTTVGAQGYHYVTGVTDATVRRQAPENGTIKALSLYVGSVLTSFRVAVYSDNNGYPGALLGESLSKVGIANQWNNFTGFNVSIVEGEYYWLGIKQQSGKTGLHADPASGGSRYTASSYGAFPADFPAGAVVENREYSIYATYNPSVKTLGKTTIGAQSYNYVTNVVEASVRRQAPENGVIKSLSLYVGNVQTSFRVAVYTDNGGYPGILLGESSSIVGVPKQWNNFTGFNVPIVAGNYYWLGIKQQSGNTGLCADAVAGGSRYVLQSYGVFPAIYPSGAKVENREYSIYASYVPT